MRIGPFLSVAVFTLAGCIPEQGPNSPALPGNSVQDPRPMQFSPAPLAWEQGNPAAAGWSTELRAQIRARLEQFDQASDIAALCPPYEGLSPDSRVEAIAALAVAIARFESDYRPTLHFPEPGLGYDSIGLFQLSYEDNFSWCNLNRATNSLEDPITNIQCAIPEMATLISRDGVIASGSDGGSARGLARYWSVVREGPTHRLAQITALTRASPACSTANAAG